MIELKGKPVADSITDKAKIRIEELNSRGISPKLAVIRVGERPDDISYERGILKRFEGAGCEYEVFTLPADCSQEELDAMFDARNNDDKIHGILLFRPLPKHLSDAHIRSSVKADKDIDAMGICNQAAMFAGDKNAFAPCTAQAVIEILHFYDIDLTGKKVTVVGRSPVIGRPVSLMLTSENATVTVCHTRTVNIEDELKNADIIVAAAGKAKMITAEMVKAGQTVIDVGMNVDENGKLCGDVDFEGVSSLVSAITPVPGGVGAVTTSVLLQNTVSGAERYLNGRM